MTDQVLQQIAREYVEQNPPLGIMDETLRQDAIDLNTQLIAKVLRWLTTRYCIVEKEVIRKEYEIAKSTHDLYTSATCINDMESRAIDHSQGRMYELTTLFGKEIFNEEK